MSGWRLTVRLLGIAELQARCGGAEAEHALQRAMKRCTQCVTLHGGQIEHHSRHALQAVFDEAAAARQCSEAMQQRLAELPPVGGVALACSATIAAANVPTAPATLSQLHLQHAGQHYQLGCDGPAFSLGRAPECSIVLTDRRASRLHARIEAAADGSFLLHDLSSNGSFVQPDGEPDRLLHHASLSLRGEGRIGLGAAPDTAQAEVVLYRLG